MANGASCNNEALAQGPAGLASASAPSASSSALPAAPAPQVKVDPLSIALEGRAGIATMCIETRSRVDEEQMQKGQVGKIITPPIYINEMPQSGINTYYVEGGPNAAKWKSFLNPTDEKRKAWLKETDIPVQANAAIDLIKRLDKDKNGIVTKDEFEKGEKAVSKEDQLIDLSFLKSMECDNMFFMEGPTNTVDPEKFPVVQGLHADLSTAVGAYKRVSAERDDYKTYFYAACGVAGFLGLGWGISSIRGRGKVRPSAPAAGGGNNPLSTISGNSMNPETVLKALRAIDGRLAKHFNENGKGLNNAGKPMTTIGDLSLKVAEDKKAFKKAEAEIAKLGDLTADGNAESAIFELIVASAETAIKFKFDTAQARADARREFVAALKASSPAPVPPAGGAAGFDDLLAGLGTPPPPAAADPAAAAPAATPPAGGPPPLPGSGGTGGTTI